MPNDATDNIYKILGAVALVDQDGAVDRIDPNILQQGDACFCIASEGYYIFRAYESSVEPTEKPFSSKNPPLVIQPDPTRFGTNTTFRWHLVSNPVNASDLQMAPGTKITVGKIQGDPNLSFYDGSGVKVAEIREDGTFWVSKLLTGSKDLVENLNAELFNGHTEDEFMLRDGSRSFTAPVSGANPTKPDHFTTKNYVDEKVQVLQPALYVRRDGTTAFEAPQSGVNPVLDDHFATKWYVDQTTDSALNKLFDMQRFIIYKTGTSSIPVGTRRLTVTFGGELSRYAVFATIVNVSEHSPSSTTAVISEQYTSYFTADFGGEIPTANYKLNWLIVGIPEGTTELPDAPEGSDTTETPSIPVLSGNNTKTVLQENTRVYISGTTGNDSNDGLTQFSPKQTIAGLLSLLNSFDTNGFKVQVIIVNPLTDVESLWFLPNYGPENLEIITGNKQELDFPGIVNIASGGCSFRNVKLRSLNVLHNARVSGRLLTLKPKNSEPAISVHGYLELTGSVTLPESTSSFIKVSGKVYVIDCTLTGPSQLTSLVNVDSGSTEFYNFTAKNVTATYTAELRNGGRIVGINKSFPGEGKLEAINPETINGIPAKWKHARQHFSDGIDPITPENIGALKANDTAVSAKELDHQIEIKLTGSIQGKGIFDSSKESFTLDTTLLGTDPLLVGFSQHVTSLNAHGATSVLKPDSIVARDSEGKTRFTAGTGPNDAVVKSQLDAIESKLTNLIFDNVLEQVQGLGDRSQWGQVGNLLFCWGSATFYNGSALVNLPKQFRDALYNVTFTAQNSLEEISFSLDSKEQKLFRASCYPASGEHTHSYLAVGLA